MPGRFCGFALAASLLAAACGGDSGPSACAPVEHVVEAGGIHVLPGAEVAYDLSPPTSGPHQLPAPTPGVSVDPVPEPLQVSALEAGLVIVHHAPELPAAERSQLEALARLDGVLVTPAATGLDASALVAFSAWGTRQLCAALDLDAAEAFIDARAGIVFVEHNG